MGKSKLQSLFKKKKSGIKKDCQARIMELLDIQVMEKDTFADESKDKPSKISNMDMLAKGRFKYYLLVFFLII